MHSYADRFPLSPAGGLFLTVIGAGILLGAFFFRAKIPLLAIGGTLGVVAATMLGEYLARGHGNPTRLQVDSLILAIGVEMAVLPFLRRALRPRGPRVVLLGVLTLVGAHFLLMAPAFGPLIVLLGLLTMGNALTGLRYPESSFRLLWLIDGGLKLVLGALLWVGSPRLPVFGL